MAEERESRSRASTPTPPATPAQERARTVTRASVATTPITEQQRVNEHGQVVEEVIVTRDAPASAAAADSLQAIQKALVDLRAIYEDVRPVENGDELADFLFKLQQAELSLMDLERYTQAQIDAGQESAHASTEG